MTFVYKSSYTKCGNEIVGKVIATCKSEEVGRAGFIFYPEYPFPGRLCLGAGGQEFYVASYVRNNGIGAELGRTALAYATDIAGACIAEVLIRTNANNSAMQKLAGKLGFKRAAQQKRTISLNYH